MSKEVKPIDFSYILKAIIYNKKAFFYVMPLVFVVASLIIISVPRSYTCEVELAPETDASDLSSLGAIGASMGINLAGKLGNNKDAISPELYPDLMKSIDFCVGLFSIEIQTKNKKIKTNYYDYLCNYQKSPWWDFPVLYIKSIVEGKDTSKFNVKKPVNPFQISKKQMDIVFLIGENVTCKVDKKTSVISIIVTDQDPLVCATIADSVKSRLQASITDYRTNKAKIDLAYYKKLYAEAKQSYEKSRQLYASYSDANQDLILESFKAKQEDLENDMQLKYNNYTSICQQLLAAQAKVQERTPAFTTLQSASVPIKPTKPKRMVFVLAMLLIAFVVTTIYSIKKLSDRDKSALEE